MSEPSVVAIILTNGRDAMLKQAIECYRRQTYPNKSLLVFDTSPQMRDLGLGTGEIVVHAHEWKESIGFIRNAAVELAKNADVIVHFDDDDHSHASRIAEQVGLLQSSGAECVGFNKCLFWDERTAMIRIHPDVPHEKGVLGVVESVGEAWLYSNPNPAYALGASLAYWRTTWTKHPFTDTPKPGSSESEYQHWFGKVNVKSVSCFPCEQNRGEEFDPRLIARIHSGNTSPAYRRELMEALETQGAEWRKAPQWSDYCRGIFSA